MNPLRPRWESLRRLVRARPKTSAGIALAILAAGMLGWIAYLSRDLPSLTQLEHYEPELSTKVLSADGKVIKEFFIKKRTLVPLERIPMKMQQAVIATEDRRFYDHWGLNLRAIARALVVDLITLSKRQGASTITQQLARQLYWNLEKKWSRKIQEQLTAIQMERTYTKREILEMYLNHMYFGHGAYGVQAAARRYFGKDVEDLTLDECALLTAVLRRPAYYSPITHPDRAKARRDLVLRVMRTVGYITEEEYQAARRRPIQVLKTSRDEDIGIAPYFTEWIRQQLEDRYGPRVYTDGLTVYTTLDTRVQACAEAAVRSHLKKLQDDVNKRLKSKNLIKEFIVPLATNGRDLKSLLADTAFVDSVITSKTAVQVAVVVLDPRDGHILAMIGGRNFNESKFNRAVQARRQPGSAFKPFVWLAAIDNGYTPVDSLLNQPVVMFLETGDRWAPHNYDGSTGGPTTLREGLRLSLNLIAARLITEVVPPQRVADYAKQLGLTTPIYPYYSLALGTSEVIPIELTAAYGAIGNKGILAQPFGILKVVDKYGNVLEENQPKLRQVLREETAYIMTDMMETVVNRGTGAGVRSLGFYRPAAGKTGTTDEWTDAWFIGYTPQIVASVWTGLDDPKMTLGPGKDGAHAAVPIWARLMKCAHDSLKLPVEDFTMPPGVLRVQICRHSKKLATEACPQTEWEVFERRLAPNDYCDIHGGLTDQETRRKERRIQF